VCASVAHDCHSLNSQTNETELAEDAVSGIRTISKGRKSQNKQFVKRILFAPLAAKLPVISKDGRLKGSLKISENIERRLKRNDCLAASSVRDGGERSVQE
jgi:hypothetical protein